MMKAKIGPAWALACGNKKCVAGVGIFMQDDLVAFIQVDTAAINSIDLDDENKVVGKRFADVAPTR